MNETDYKGSPHRKRRFPLFALVSGGITAILFFVLFSMVIIGRASMTGKGFPAPKPGLGERTVGLAVIIFSIGAVTSYAVYYTKGQKSTLKKYLVAFALGLIPIALMNVYAWVHGEFGGKTAPEILLAILGFIPFGYLFGGAMPFFFVLGTDSSQKKNEKS